MNSNRIWKNEKTHETEESDIIIEELPSLEQTEQDIT